MKKKSRLARTGSGLRRGVGPLLRRACPYFVCVRALQLPEGLTCRETSVLCLPEVKYKLYHWGDSWVKVVTFDLCCPQ